MEKFYIFLDIDGVLNSDPLGLYEKIEKQNVKVLDDFLLELKEHDLNPIIVISSNWRLRSEKYEKLKGMLSKTVHSYSNEYISLPSGLNSIKGLQIGEFLNKNNVENSFVIIDDNIDEIARFFPKKHIIHTKNEGLTQENIDDFLTNFFKTNNSKPSEGRLV